MKIPLKKYLFAALAAVVSFVPVAFAQDVDWKTVPFIEVKDVKHNVIPLSGGYTGKWAVTAVELKASTCLWAPDFKVNDWLNNVKVTLTLAYPKTNTALSGVKARGNKETRDATLKESEERTGSDTNSNYIFYRASVTLVGLQIGAGQSSYVNFLIPSEIVDRESKLSNEMTGQAKPKFYLIEFSHGGNALPVCKPNGELLSRKALDFPGGPRPQNAKSAAEFVRWVQDNAQGSVSETKGLLIPHYFLPVTSGAWPRKNVPAIIYENIEQ